MKFKYILCLIFLAAIRISVFSQDYSIVFQKTVGGNGSDKLTKMLNTSDGGLILCGYSNSNISGDKTQNSLNGSYDFWVVKVNSSGKTLWAKTYGGTDRDLNPSIIQTSDGGYLIGGSSISPASGVKTENAINQSFDYWVIKLDKSGNVIWDNTIGGIQFEKCAAVLESQSGYFICGSSYSGSGYDKTAENEGSSIWPDFWMVKLDKSGKILWDSVYGSKNRDELTAAKITYDGGIILGGTSYSPKFGDKSSDYLGNGDYWIIKLDSTGTRQWDKTIGGSLSDYLTSIDLVGSIGYVLVGYSNSPASFNKSDGCRGGTDYWIVRTDKFGNPLWNKTFGGDANDYATSVQFLNSKYFIGGYSNSGISGDKTIDSVGGYDFWTLILDKNGALTEQEVWGGKGDDYLTDYMVSGTGYLLAGTSSSGKGKNKRSGTVGNTGNPDYWFFRILPVSSSQKLSDTTESLALNSNTNLKSSLFMQFNPNPVHDLLNINYGGAAPANVSISVYSNDGKLISRKTLLQASGNYTLDLSSKPAGIYYAVLQSGNSSITNKFVKN